MNWKRILAYAILLFASEFIIGFFEGTATKMDSGPVIQSFLVSNALTFISATVIFSVMATGQTSRPLAHAALAFLMFLILSAMAAALIYFILSGDTYFVLASVNLLVLIAALLVGTLLGLLLRNHVGRDPAA